MKTTLIALNASYSHTSLACAYLKSFCQDSRWSIDIMEFTINDHYGLILSRLFAAESYVYGFSCYIWNIDLILKLCHDLKLIRPDCFIVLGGPEVSYDAGQLMREQQQIDAVVCGEGEITMRQLLQNLVAGQAPAVIPGLVIRQGHKLITGPSRLPLPNLDQIPSPLPFMSTRRRLVYYETSRGCPFSCSYCLSSCERGVRFFSLERVQSDLLMLMQSEAQVVKLVDRSFNCQEKRARRIMEFILVHNRSTRFHFEINAELLSAEMIDFLSAAPAGVFDFEIGIQSTYPPTLAAIQRRTDWGQLSDRIRQLQKNGNIHLHVDLIAGLPYENYRRFGESFNQVFKLRADVIQLGFLKMLKGSPLREQADNYHYTYQDHAPYEALGNEWISFIELSRLHLIEDMLERYYNSHCFERTMDNLIGQIYQDDAFRFLEDLAREWQKNNYHLCRHSREAEFIFLLGFIQRHCPSEHPRLQELLKMDYLTFSPTGHIPDELERFNPHDQSDCLYSYLKDEGFIARHLSDLIPLSLRQRRRRIHLEWLKLNIDSNTYSSSARPTFFVYNSSRSKLETVFQP